jgi:hypothetical protein
MATAPAAQKPAATADKAPKADKPKKDPKPLLQRLDEQVTRAVISKKLTIEEMTKFEARVGKLKGLLEE